MSRKSATFYVHMECTCEATIELDVVPGDEAGAWGLVHRFANAHVKCGYVAPLAGQPQPEQSSAPDQWPGALS